jgi:hypothetical protein
MCIEGNGNANGGGMGGAGGAGSGAGGGAVGGGAGGGGAGGGGAGCGGGAGGPPSSMARANSSAEAGRSLLAASFAQQPSDPPRHGLLAQHLAAMGFGREDAQQRAAEAMKRAPTHGAAIQ